MFYKLSKEQETGWTVYFLLCKHAFLGSPFRDPTFKMTLTSLTETGCQKSAHIFHVLRRFPALSERLVAQGLRGASVCVWYRYEDLGKRTLSLRFHGQALLQHSSLLPFRSTATFIALECMGGARKYSPVFLSRRHRWSGFVPKVDNRFTKVVSSKCRHKANAANSNQLNIMSLSQTVSLDDILLPIKRTDVLCPDLHVCYYHV